MKKMQKLFLLLGIISLAFVSCEDDGDGGKIDVSKDGAYVSGAAVGGIDVKLADGYVEGSNFAAYAREGLYETYFYCSAGDLEFKIIADDQETLYGPSATPEATVLDGSDDQISGTMWTGELASGKAALAISEDGFYHIMFDETSMRYWVVKIDSWEWVAGPIELELQANPSAEEVIYSATNVRMATGASKIRYNNGWKILTDVAVLTENEDKTDNDEIILFTNFGNNEDGILMPGGGNIDITKGVYTISVSWTPATGIALDLNKTADVENTDYSTHMMGFIGSAVMVADTSWGWNHTFNKKEPAKNGEIYTWSWDGIEISDTTNGNAWKIREGDNWDFSLGYDNVTMSGTAAADFFSRDGNFGVANRKTYNFDLQVNADDDSWTLTAEEAN